LGAGCDGRGRVERGSAPRPGIFGGMTSGSRTGRFTTWKSVAAVRWPRSLLWLRRVRSPSVLAIPRPVASQQSRPPFRQNFTMPRFAVDQVPGFLVGENERLGRVVLLVVW